MRNYFSTSAQASTHEAELPSCTTRKDYFVKEAIIEKGTGIGGFDCRVETSLFGRRNSESYSTYMAQI